MLSDTTIADVEDTLITLLRNEMADLVPEGEQQIVLLSPAEAVGRQVRLTLFLYAVVETPYLKNEPRHIETTTDEEFSPLALDLYYMLTCYGSEDIPEHDRSLEAHQVLGRAMRVFYDNGILSGSILRGNLADTREELRISLNPITLEDLTRIWSVFPDTPYRTSVSYVVTPVNIRSTRRVREQRVVAKETDVDRMVPRGEGI